MGPQYLQDLVTEYHAPRDASNDDGDSDSGEDKLGGLPRSQHGSSSASAGVEAGVMSSQDNSGNGGAGQGNSLMGMTNDSWSFANLAADNDSAGSDDAGSTTAQGGTGDGSAQGDSTIAYEENWQSSDATWQGLSPAGDATEHVENADDDRVEEIRLGGPSSSHEENELELE